ncbi:hypothetical protein ACIQU4_28240 [Streptomyces sp. NPDC090741]|uniref:hypothetical protein n=1 Tax=Streptomyces sp. NPDC090741 TaxID=3365967 RepID=UPI0038220F40
MTETIVLTSELHPLIAEFHTMARRHEDRLAPFFSPDGDVSYEHLRDYDEARFDQSVEAAEMLSTVMASLVNLCGPAAASTRAPRTVVHEILAEHRTLTARHHNGLKEFCDIEGITEGYLDEYEEREKEQALEADEHLQDFMKRLTEAFGLPTDRTVTVLGANSTTYEVTPSRLDDAARALFNNGQCHAFATALAGATGWPTAAVIHPECDDTYDNCGMGNQVADDVCICQIGHVVAVRPDGALIDIDGVNDPTDIDDSPEHDLVPMTDALWKLIDNAPTWRDRDVAVARTFVQPLLDSLAADAAEVSV